jgi:hypothetical protein
MILITLHFVTSVPFSSFLINKDMMKFLRGWSFLLYLTKVRAYSAWHGIHQFRKNFSVIAVAMGTWNILSRKAEWQSIGL